MTRYSLGGVKHVLRLNELSLLHRNVRSRGSVANSVMMTQYTLENC